MSSTVNTSPAHIKTLETRKLAVLELLAPLPPPGADLAEYDRRTAPLLAEYEALKNELDAIDDIIFATNAELERRINAYYEV